MYLSSTYEDVLYCVVLTDLTINSLLQPINVVVVICEVHFNFHDL